ncbi:MAG: hydrolase [Deferrisomatales bacterium]|nr:hydrolase [Deferrisomatales bacterium]
MAQRPTREQAWNLLCEHVPSENLRRHALAVEAVMRHIARQRGEDEEAWGLVGLIHDVDYEEHPTEHLQHTEALLRDQGWPEELTRAVLAHGWGICTQVEPKTPMEQTLYAIDELTGLVAAAALVRPSKSVLDLPVKSVRKKWKDKAFAAGVDRSVIQNGADMLGVELAQLIGDTIEGMRGVAAQIGLEGQG